MALRPSPPACQQGGGAGGGGGGAVACWAATGASATRTATAPPTPKSPLLAGDGGPLPATRSPRAIWGRRARDAPRWRRSGSRMWRPSGPHPGRRPMSPSTSSPSWRRCCGGAPPPPPTPSPRLARVSRTPRGSSGRRGARGAASAPRRTTERGSEQLRALENLFQLCVRRNLTGQCCFGRCAVPRRGEAGQSPAALSRSCAPRYLAQEGRQVVVAGAVAVLQGAQWQRGPVRGEGAQSGSW
jgi:hypothetical protein